MVNMNHFRDPAVYALHAGDFLYHYVGSTSVNTTARMYEHTYRARHNHGAPVYAWMREVGIQNVKIVTLVSEADRELRETLEVTMIAQLIAGGHPLVNQNSRDGRPNSMSVDTRAKIGAQARGKVTWIKGKTGTDAGWTDERRALVASRRKPKPEPKRPLVRVPRHGTRTEWEKYKCKCAECRLAGARRNAKQRGRPIPQ